MKNLVARSCLFQDLFDYRRDLDQVLGRELSGGTFVKAPPVATSAGSLLAIESYIDKNAQNYHCRVSRPGVDPRIIELRARRETVTIRGKRRTTGSEEDLDSHYQEIIYGLFERTFTLPRGVDTEQLTTEYRNGVLELPAHVAADGLPRPVLANTRPRFKRIAA